MKGGVDFDRVTAKMSMIQQIIDQHFLYDEDAGNVEDFIYRGMLAGLDDPYSAYYTEEDYQFHAVTAQREPTPVSEPC